MTDVTGLGQPMGISRRSVGRSGWPGALPSDVVDCPCAGSGCSGRVQAALTIEPQNEWDLAAGVLLVQESGGTVADPEGRPFTFNQATPRFRGVIAVSATAPTDLHPFLQTHADRARTKKKRL